MNELFPFRHDFTSCQDTHDGRHFARRLPAAVFAPQSAAAGDSRNLHGSCVESPCGLGGPDVETRCAGVCQGVSDADAARRCCYDRGHRRAVFCPVPCWGGCGKAAGKLRKSSVPVLRSAYIKRRSHGKHFILRADCAVPNGTA